MKPPRKVYGLGPITRERGRFRLRVPDGRGHYKPGGTYDTWDEADRIRRAIAAERGDTPIGAVSLAEYGEQVLQRWIRAGLRDVKPHRSRLKIVARATFALDPVQTLTRTEIRDWARGLPAELAAHGRPLSWQSQKHALGLLCRVLDEAREDGLIDVNPAKGVKLPRRQARAEGWSWLTLDEIAAVLALELSPQQRLAIVLSVYQGLRQGELAALRWEDVDLDAGWLVVAGSWTGATKTGRTRRIELLEPAAAALRNISRNNPRSILVLPSPGGGLYARGYDWGWGDRRNGAEDIPTRAGIGRRVRWHDLRHTCASHLVSGSWGPPWTLAEVAGHLGHSVGSTTARYAHLVPDALRKKARQTGAQPAANLPHDVSTAAAQVLDFVRRAISDSNRGPLAPEIDGSVEAARGCADPRQLRGRSTAEVALAVLEAAAAGGGAQQADLDHLAAAVLSAGDPLRALLALTGGPDAVRAGLELAEALAARPAPAAALVRT